MSNTKKEASSEQSSKKYSLVIFDWEGTLADLAKQTLARVVDAHLSLLKPFTEDDEHLKSNVLQVAKQLFPLWSDEELERISDIKMVTAGCDVAGVYLLPGAKALIERLAVEGVDLAIASNKGQQSLQVALQRSALQPYFRVTRSAGQVPPKPCPQMLEEILVEFAVDASDALMVGDSVADIEMAGLVGMDAVGIDFYHQNTEALLQAGAKVVFDYYPDLAKFLNLSIK